MGVMSYRMTSNHLLRCDLCKKVTHTVYAIELDGIKYKFCSGAHADAARRNFEEKKRLGVTAASTEMPTDAGMGDEDE